MNAKAVIFTLPILVGCSIINPSSNQLLIATEFAFFSAPDTFRAAVIFKNNLGRNVYIINVGCREPNFLLQQSVNQQWKTVGAPLCVALAVPPTLLPDGKQFTAPLFMYSDSLVEGTYRLTFDIRETDFQPVLGQNLSSDSFMLHN